ncbi:MAG: septation ring formation regulator EzrA [Bacteroidetes bacterium SW_9_63_38]|nr:MAG: septation ring formation regulator EzrA [Bacteroidetes bacterium SW_9_63_38]
MPLPRPDSAASLRWWLLGGAVLLLLVWIMFFDSHSLLRRYQWHQEHDRLTQENEQLRRDIQQLRKKLDRPLSDSLVERIAREEYGMKRPNETVYRLKESR